MSSGAEQANVTSSSICRIPKQSDDGKPLMNVSKKGQTTIKTALMRMLSWGEQC